MAAVLTGAFEFPTGEDELEDVEAGDDRPAHVVDLEAGGSAVYHASAIEAGSFDDESSSVDGEATTDVVDEDVTGLEEPPEWWDRESVVMDGWVRRRSVANSRGDGHNAQ